MSNRRTKVDFDPDHFAKLDPTESMEAGEVFAAAHRERLWGSRESLSGPGSTEDQTAQLRGVLPTLFRELEVTTVLDLPCGDFNWMSLVALGDIHYIGGDIVPDIVSKNTELHGAETRQFRRLDLRSSTLPRCDLLLCRDCLVHLSFADIERVLGNVANSRITYLLTTTFPEEENNLDVRTGDWRPLDLESPPFAFPKPLRLFNEGCSENRGLFADKSLGLWRVSDLPMDGAT